MRSARKGYIDYSKRSYTKRFFIKEAFILNDLEDELIESVALARSSKYQFEDALNILLPWSNNANEIDETNLDQYDAIYDEILNGKDEQ